MGFRNWLLYKSAQDSKIKQFGNVDKTRTPEFPLNKEIPVSWLFIRTGSKGGLTHGLSRVMRTLIPAELYFLFWR